MILFKDFAPERLEKGGIFKKSIFEGLQETVDRMNTWRSSDSRNKVLNIETVVLPNIHNKGEEGSADTDLRVIGEVGANWHQVLRVWYTKE